MFAFHDPCSGIFLPFGRLVWGFSCPVCRENQGSSLRQTGSRVNSVGPSSVFVPDSAEQELLPSEFSRRPTLGRGAASDSRSRPERDGPAIPDRFWQGCRPAAAEAIARANYRLRLGKFELVADGEVRFQVSQILVDEAVGQAVIDMIGTTGWTYLPALLSVIYANELPKEAIARVEAGFCGHDPGDE
jgi:hypothetical protein